MKLEIKGDIWESTTCNVQLYWILILFLLIQFT